MADLVMIRFGEMKSKPRRSALLRRVRDTLGSALPKGAPHYKLGTIKHGRFKLEVPGGEGTVEADGALFDLDDPDFTTISLVYDLAKAGGMAMVSSGGPSDTILFERAEFKAVPAAFRRPKPVLCTSAAHLARMLGVSTKIKPARAPKLGKKHQWSRDHDNRYLGRLPGLTEDPKELYIYVETKPGEGLEGLTKDLFKFIRALKKQKKAVPDGGALGSMLVHKELRLPTGEIFIPLGVTGYSCRPNSDHLIPANIERWLSIARAFCRQTRRDTGTILKGRTFRLDNGRRYPLSRLESRTAPTEPEVMDCSC